MLAVFIERPWLAFVVAAGVLAMGARRRARGLVVMGGLWAAYGVYEQLMRWRVLCSGECNIRIDLLLLYPVLLGATLVAVGAALRRRPT